MIRVDGASAVPPYEQIRVQVRALVDGGVLADGDRLPPIRQLAGDLGLAPNTVQRAYRELEADGLVESRGRHGTIVRAVPATPGAAATAGLKEAAEHLAHEARDSGTSLEEAIKALRGAFARVSDAGGPGLRRETA